MPDYVTQFGFERLRQTDIKINLQNAWKKIYTNPQLSDESTNGQTIGALSEAIADLWEMAEGVYNAFLVGSTVGYTQDQLYRLNGIGRRTAEPSSVILTISGTPGVVVAAGFRAADVNGLTFATLSDATIGIGGTVDASAECIVLGTLLAPAGSLTTITNPVYGVTAVTNAADAVPGVDRESDALFRLRRDVSTGSPGQNLLEAAFAQLFDLDGVQGVRIYQNRTSITDPVTGLPAHSWQPVLIGGDDQEIAIIVWRNTSAGIASTGSTSVEILDNQGFIQTINFQRAILSSIYIDIDLNKDVLEYPADGDSIIRQTIIDYAAGKLFEETDFTGFGIGEDILISRLYTPINRVQGHYVTRLEISDIGFGSVAPANIDILYDQIGAFDASRIRINGATP